jgi:hypothetical protein
MHAMLKTIREKTKITLYSTKYNFFRHKVFHIFNTSKCGKVKKQEC